MAVAFDAQSNADTTGAAAVSFSDSTNLTVGSGTNRALVALLAWSSTTAPTGVSITWDGVALSSVPGAASNHLTAGNTAIYGLVNPNSGTKTFAGSWTGSKDFYVAAVTYTGVEQSGAANAFITGSIANGGSTSATKGLDPAFGDTALGNANVAIMGASQNFTSVTEGIQVFLDNTQTAKGCGARIAGSNSIINLTAGVLTSTGNWSISTCQIVASAGAVVVSQDCVTLMGVGG